MKKGNEENPIEISCAEELAFLGKEEYPDTHFVLTEDIFFNSYESNIYSFFYSLLANKPPYGKFKGHIDGQGHTIHNLRIDNQESSWVSCLFSTNKGVIENLNVKGFNIEASGRIGGIVGENHGKIKSCHSIGNIQGDRYLGGIVGINFEDGEITNCSSEVEISGGEYVGGITGHNQGNVSSSSSDGSIVGDEKVGGIVGTNHPESLVTGSSSSSYVSAKFGKDIGGLVGCNSSKLEDSYFNGEIKEGIHNYEGCGALVGKNKGEVNNCYWTISNVPEIYEPVGDNNNGEISSVSPKSSLEEIENSLVIRKI